MRLHKVGKTLSAKLRKILKKKSTMNANKEVFVPFPAYESVFYDDIEHNKKYFLPLCSVNLKFLFPDRDEWYHFISVKEIFTGCVGEHTEEFHTKYSKCDMLGFDVIDGKYKFDASWDYFYINHKHKQENNIAIINQFDQERHKLNEKIALTQWINSTDCPSELKARLIKIASWCHKAGKENDCRQAIKALKDKYDLGIFAEIEEAYHENEMSWQIAKAYYERFGMICTSSISDQYNLQDPEDIEYTREDDYPEFFGFINDIKFKSKESQELIKDYNISIAEVENFENTNLIEKPYNEQGEIFEYIGSLTGYNFQSMGADQIYLFRDNALKKAVICLEYT